MIKVGNLIALANGRFVVGPKPFKLLITFSLFLLPVILVLVFGYVPLNQFNTFIPAAAVLGTLYLLTILSILMVAWSDPGVVPSVHLVTKIFN